MSTPVLDRAAERALRQEWRTPQDFWKVLNEEFAFDVDVAADRENALCNVFITAKQDALGYGKWFGYVEIARISSAYCNPGFGNIDAWVRKAYSEVQRESGPSCTAVVLACASHAKWFDFSVRHAHEIRLLTPRVQFTPPPGIKASSNARDSVLMVFRRTPANWPGAHIWLWNWKERTDA